MRFDIKKEYIKQGLKLEVVFIKFVFLEKKSTKIGDFSAIEGKNVHYSEVNLQQNFNGEIFFSLTGVISLLGIFAIGEFYCKN